MSSIRYRPEVDGLRAVAILPVLIFHLTPSWLPGGFAGVDVFFVISGYLISSIIFTELQSGAFAFSSFWERRIRRIIPPLLLMMSALVLVSAVLGVPIEQWVYLGRQVLRVLTFSANYSASGLAGGYWGSVAEQSPLLHTWSLSVEEQFYLIFPVLIYILWRICRPAIGWVLLIGGVLSFAAGLWAIHHNPSSAYFLLPYRAWQLFGGAWVAHLTSQGHKVYPDARWSRFLAVTGLATVVISLFTLSGLNYPGWKALAPTLGAMIYIAFSEGGGIASRVLRTRPAVFVGRASYSLYLWHWPALVLGGWLALLFEQPWLRSACFGLSLLAAIAVFWWIEPLAKTRRGVVHLSILSALTMSAVAVWIAFCPKPSQPPANSPTQWGGVPFESVDLAREIKEMNQGQRFAMIDVAMPQEREGRMRIVRTGPAGKPARIVVFGDSHGQALAPLLSGIAESIDASAAFVTASAIPPFLVQHPPLRISAVEHETFNRIRLKLLSDEQPSVVVLIARWDSAVRRGDISELPSLVRAINAVAPQAHVVIIGQPPMLSFGDQNATQWLAWRARYGLEVDSLLPAITAEWKEGQAYLRRYACPSFHSAVMAGKSESTSRPYRARQASHCVAF